MTEYQGMNVRYLLSRPDRGHELTMEAWN
jgi:hypothetical protein